MMLNVVPCRRFVWEVGIKITHGRVCLTWGVEISVTCTRLFVVEGGWVGGGWKLMLHSRGYCHSK